MPNWIEGNIRFRGKKKDIENFIENEIVYVAPNKDWEYEEVKPEIEKTEDYLTLSIPKEHSYDSFYFRNTRRNFIFSGSVEVGWPEAEEDEDIIVILDDFNSAWSFNEQGWADHAKKYNIDIRMFGYEQGMQFSEVMTIARDGTITNEHNKYEDWNWECPFPNLGG